MLPVIYGLAGPQLSESERAFFRDADPAGYILFARNIVDRGQLRALTDSLRALSGRDDLPILIDQEGGRVQRMRAPEWHDFPAGPRFDALYEIAPVSAIEAARTNAEAIAVELAEAGITVDCLPLLDVAGADTHPAIAERALGHDPLRVAALGRAILDGLRRGGIAGVIKHMPGQGRAVVDSHHDLPTVTASDAELEVDIAPFRTLANTGFGMTGHIVFNAWDADNCVTHSAKVIAEIIRGRVGFDGFLMTDDIDMKALGGTPAEKATRAIAAGCDAVLDCWGRMEEMVAIAGALDPMLTISRERLERAMAARTPPAEAPPIDELIARRDALLALA